MNNWMKKLALHYHKIRERHADDRLMILFDVDGTILDTRNIVLRILQSFDRRHGTRFFADLRVSDIHVHENQVELLLAETAMPADMRGRVLDWYRKQRWSSGVLLESHRPFQGVMEVIRWFQIQPRTYVGLNTGKPESIREDTLRTLNGIGREFKVAFEDEFLRMNPYGWDTEVQDAKVGAVLHFREQGYRIFAFVDHDPENLEAVAKVDPDREILLLCADSICESRRSELPAGSVAGESYDLTELVQEKALPQHIHFVWHGVNDEANLRQFLASNVQWAEFDVRTDPSGRDLVLRHDSFAETPVVEDEEFLLLEDTLEFIRKAGKSVKLDLKEGGSVIDHVMALLEHQRFEATRLWFNASIQTLGEAGFRRLASAYPAAVLQCPVDFLAPLVSACPEKARDLLDILAGWGMNRFSVSWKTPGLRQLLDRLDAWGYEANIYNLPDLESFLKAVLLLPRSITSDFNFPKWHYYGRGAGQNHSRYEYVIKRNGPDSGGQHESHD